ncbi:hypothetical protein [Serratia grimesii]|jgi:hypothetical protein|uniref:Uncharacterized protein n=1 Tax=Serratia grimesii TaxID=82995 RepID=A0A7G2JJ03_9GAMM|nr:hypothetical protein [Serratia grimesii]KFB89437.1 hypothetical protein CR62_18785 [Serratia grimesii]CAI0739255.1 Uncharacterised protein [Serratia grimesii]CAI0814848.1 Uncharacterised protein [Serratia grimesii]CAI2468440.1 Uncharacterised protein [Serratia grimesii]CAI2791782.1 Uncharacterised protein [Serratia grimesii]
MMIITRLHPLHHQIDNPADLPKHVGETVFDSSMHPADVAQLIALHQLGTHKALPSWKARLSALCRKLYV